jgi:hypothetical protein
LKNFTAVNSSSICHQNTFENGVTINDCDLWVENKVDSKSLGWLMVSYDPFRPNPSGTIKKFEYLTENTRGSLFKVYGDDGAERYMSFQLRYYEANAGGDNYTGSDNVPSGAYIFKPAKDKQYSMPYTSLIKQESFNLGFV